MFDPGQVARDHHQADSGRLLSAHLSGIAFRHARWGGLTEAEKASGAAELREVAGDCGDLLAEVAGLALGSADSRGPEYEARGQAVAELCRMAGADEALIPSGSRRAVAAPRPLSCRPSVGRIVHHAGPEPAWPWASGATSHPPRYPGPSSLIPEFRRQAQ